MTRLQKVVFADLSPRTLGRLAMVCEVGDMTLILASPGLVARPVVTVIGIEIRGNHHLFLPRCNEAPETLSPGGRGQGEGAVGERHHRTFQCG